MPIRDTDQYKALRKDITNALNTYWNSYHSKEMQVDACEDVTIASFRLLKYMKKYIGESTIFIDNSKIQRYIGDVANRYYNIHNFPIHEEVELLEIISRTAYSQMKRLYRECAVTFTCVCGQKQSTKNRYCTNCGIFKRDALDVA